MATTNEARDNMARVINCKVVGYVEELHEPGYGRKHIGVVASRKEGMHIENTHFYNFNHGN
ncbi:MAG: hypothetical protein QF535_07375, partial [Anaerolineales bacterium]|nr:hypothetical protein [Anaerolineales bacterium]